MIGTKFVRQTSVLAAALVAWVGVPARAADPLQIHVTEHGLQSLTYRGVEYVDPAGAGAVGFSGAGAGPRAAAKEDAAVFVTTPTSVAVAGTKVTQAYPWGTLVVAYEARGADLTVTATLRNTSGKGLQGWRANVLQLNDRIVFRPGGDPHGSSINMQWCHYYELNAGQRDGYKHLTQQYPHVYWWVDFAAPFDRQAVKVMFADLTGTWDTGVNRIKTDQGDRWPVFVAAMPWEMAPPGKVQGNTVKVAIRFRDQDPALRPLADKLYAQAQAMSARKPAVEAPVKPLPSITLGFGEDGAGGETNLPAELDAVPADAATKATPPSPAALAAQAKLEQAAAWRAFATAYEQSMPSALAVCADGYEAWGRYNRREVSWSDRRAIGAFFGCPDAATSAKNPNGWFKDPEGVDTTTPEGRQAFAQRLLERVDASIKVLEQAGAQGVIWWDLEGHRYPQPHITWVADPRVLDPQHPHYQAFAPELNTPVEYNGATMPVVDACFRKWQAAGFKTGVTLRPQVMTYWLAVPVDQAQARLAGAQQRTTTAQDKLATLLKAFNPELDEAGPLTAARDELKQAQAELGKAQAELATARLGAIPKQQIYDDGGKETLPKAKYARDRWGCTLFYLDSISGVFGYWAMDAAARELPDCLFLPEWATARSYRCSAQLSVTWMTGYRQGVPAELQAAWPDAFCAMFHLDFGGMATGKNEAARQDLVTAVKRGNLPVFDCFYNNTDAINVIRDVYATTGVKHAPRASDQSISTAPEQPVTIHLTATDEDDEALTFCLLGPPAYGALSAFEAKAGTAVYAPPKGWTGTVAFTFKAVDAAGLNSNRGTVTVTVK